MDEIDDRLYPAPAGRQAAEPLPSIMTELIGQTEPARHHERQRLVGQRRDRSLGRVRGDLVGGIGEQQLGLVGDAGAARFDREALAPVRIAVAVAMMLRARVPLLALELHSGLGAGRDLHHRGNGLWGLELELTADRQREVFRLCAFLLCRGEAGHPPRASHVPVTSPRETPFARRSRPQRRIVVRSCRSPAPSERCCVALRRRRSPGLVRACRSGSPVRRGPEQTRRPAR